MGMKMGTFRYGLALRPAGIGCIPKGAYELEPALQGRGQPYTRHGVISFERKLNDAELYSFDLTEIATPEECVALASEICESIKCYASGYLELQSDSPDVFSSEILRKVGDLRKHRIFIEDQECFLKNVLENLAQISSNKEVQLANS
jgi:Defence against restriction A C-terminal